MRMSRVSALLALSLALVPAVGGARTLYWQAIDVGARLDADGRLHVRERQTMVFDGDWNGGERVFNLRSGQNLTLHGLTRIDPETGGPREVLPGNLGRVDRWQWTSRNVLRWRSRLPTDPVFADQTIVYVLDYSMAGILRQRGGAFRLDHDFAFPDRAGKIERFTLDLELDPVWQASPELDTRIVQTNLLPGTSVVVTADLTYTGEGHPAAVERLMPVGTLRRLFAAVLAATVLLVGLFFRHERKHGRYTRPAIPDTVDRSWLEANLFDLEPEIAGALWDNKTGPREVAALIARLVAEGKLSSQVVEVGRFFKRPELSLDLLAERDEFEDYERALIDKLFYGGRSSVTTADLKKRYRSTGFDPAGTIAPGIKRRIRTLTGSKPLSWSRWPLTLLLVIAFLSFLGIQLIFKGGDSVGPIAAALLIGAPLVLIWAYVAAFTYRRAATATLSRAALFLLPIGILTAGSLAFAWAVARGLPLLPDLPSARYGAIAVAIFPLIFTLSVLHRARTRDRAPVAAKRQIVAAARKHLARQLKRSVPDLDDDWLPYLLALGLGGRVDAWAKTHGAASARHTPSTTSSGGGSSWTGGGGAFGGAGATAAWSAAASSMAGGVAKPSSGGSGGGGGGGGGSSGGGGGGGW